MRSNLRRMFGALALTLALLALAACGGSPSAGGGAGGSSGGAGGAGPATLADIPSFPEASAVKPGESPIADTLAQNVKQNAQMGQKLDQQMFTLPDSATWDQIKTFYTDKLGAAGWKSANLPIPDNPTMQMSVWTRGTQNLTVARMATDPSGKGAFLLFSLATN